MPFFKFRGSTRQGTVVSRLVTPDINQIQRSVPVGQTIELSDTQQQTLAAQHFDLVPDGTPDPPPATAVTQDLELAGTPTEGQVPQFTNGLWVPASVSGVGAGTPGPAGKSAYELWLDAGNSGDVNTYLASLHGAPGAPGTPGADGTQGIQGPKGDKGDPGPKPLVYPLAQLTNALAAAHPGEIAFATDDNGGRAYISDGTTWTKLGAAVLETGGRELGSASYNTANVATPAGGAATDVPGLSVAFTAGARPVNVIIGAEDMSNNTAGAITLFQAVRTDTGAAICAVRGGGTNYPANSRLPCGSVIGRMSGLTPGNNYTVKGQIVGTGAGVATLLSGNSPGYGAFIQVVEV